MDLNSLNQKPDVKSEEKKSPYSDEDMRQWLVNDVPLGGNICCAIHGFDGTGKTGVALDCRSAEDIKAGKKILLIDFDGGAIPLWTTVHKRDPNILIRDPLVRVDGVVDYELTFIKLKKLLDYVEKNILELNLKAIVIDGLDQFLKICEYKMKEDYGNFGKSETEGFNRMLWKFRNMSYHDILSQVKLMHCDKYFITHEKEVYDKGGPTGEFAPDWEKKSPDMMAQIINMSKKVSKVGNNRVTEFVAKVEKFKNNLALVGREFCVAKVSQLADGNVESHWYSLQLTEDNNIIQRK